MVDNKGLEQELTPEEIENKKAEEKKIRAVKTKLRRFIKDLDTDDKTIPNLLIDELSFLVVTLENLREEINTKGAVIPMRQGGYWIQVSNPALKSYTSVMQRYNICLRDFQDVLKSRGVAQTEGVNLVDFVKSK